MSAPASGRQAVFCWLLLAVVVALAIALRSLVAANTDVSWLLTVCDKILGGQHLYVDIIETNPPIAIWVYMPADVIARALHLRAEAVTDTLVFAGVALSMAISAAMLRQSAISTQNHRALFLTLATTSLLIVPMQAFAQREHLAVIAILPAMAGYVLRAERRNPAFWQIIVAGVSAGITLAFKPYFAIALAAALLTAAFYARTWRILFVQENFIAAALLAIYGAMTYVVYPAYFITIYPLVRDVYLPLKRPLGELIASNGILLSGVALLMTLLAIRKRRPEPAVAIVIAAAIGFGCAYIAQRKGWPYQSYPMLAFALLALALQLCAPGAAAHRASRASALACLAGLIMGAMVWMSDGSNADILQPAVRQLGPHPRILALTAEPSIGHPLTRAVGGEWVSRQQALWVREAVKRIEAGDYGSVSTGGLDAYVARERDWLVDDIKRTPPTVILVDNLLSDWGAWAAADPFFADLLKKYRRVDTIQHIDILALRNDAELPTQKQ